MRGTPLTPVREGKFAEGVRGKVEGVDDVAANPFVRPSHSLNDLSLPCISAQAEPIFIRPVTEKEPQIMGLVHHNAGVLPVLRGSLVSSRLGPHRKNLGGIPVF